jgi:type 1 glutamine amidotransferase
MKALIVYGGWAGHEPGPVSEIIAKALKAHRFEVSLSDTLDSFNQLEALLELDLIVPHWTAGKLSNDQSLPIYKAVASGTGIAGTHGGMGDAFRGHTGYNFMVGGQFVDHPGGWIKYRVYIVDHADPITADLKSFSTTSEQYYMHVDPSNHVLATTTFECNGCTMPVSWKRMWGKGRVFYSSLGHCAKEFSQVPEVLTLLTGGMLWAAEGKEKGGTRY